MEPFGWTGAIPPVELQAMDGQISPHGVIIPEISH